MSASLVGSEMCIRDSLRGEWRRPRQRHLRRPSQATGGWRRFCPLRSPVSYTHLTLPTICSV
eukprot:11036307-Alexandrium_andersonii.AAC.1